MSMLALVAGFAAAALCLPPGPARAVTATLTLTADSLSTSDAWVREDNTTQNNGGSADLGLRTSSDHSNRQSLIRIPLSGLTNRTVLQAWLDVKQTSATSTTPIDTRAFALTEAFNEAQVSWANRDRTYLLFIPIDTPWTTPGGTHGVAWTDRALVSSAGINASTRFQVGPIVEAWNDGTLANDGLLLMPTSTAPAREAVFASSDRIGIGTKPSLVIQFTDSPPAIARGTAEIQPRTVHTAGKNLAFAAWLDVDALGSTPSGTPTGFDRLVMTHRGALAVTGVDSLRMGNATFPGSVVAWKDDGTSVTFELPHATLRGTVKLSFRADVLAKASADGIDLPMLVDDSTTPGATAQALWSGNANGTAGDGDGWLVAVVSTPAVAIDLQPSSAQIPNHTCLQLTCTMRDAAGLTFSLPPDSVTLRPRNAGTVGTDLLFCATKAGAVKLIGCYGTLRDTSGVSVQPDQTTTLEDVTLRNAAGLASRWLVPGDTTFVDLTLSDPNGLTDVDSLRFDLQYTPAATDAPGRAAYGASFQWTRGAAPASWTLLLPTGTSWQVLPAACSFDESSTSTLPQPARLAFRVGQVARASQGGQWTLRVRASSLSPASVTDTTVTGLDATVSFVLKGGEGAAVFGAGPPGSMGLPLAAPADGALHYEVLANTAVLLEALAGDLIGAKDPRDTLRVDAASANLKWSLDSKTANGGVLDTTWTPLASVPAAVDETPIATGLHLWLDYPPGLREQDYDGGLLARLRATDSGTVSDTATASLQGNVVVNGLAADSALAEVTPHQVTAGTPGQAFVVDVLPLQRGSSTGIDDVRVGFPVGYGTPSVTAVLVAGASAAFTDASVPGTADVQLDSKVLLGQRIEIRLTVGVPTDLDAGSTLVVAFDDRSSSVGPQIAIAGDANAIADGDNLQVQVVAGPLARLSVAPRSLTIAQGRDTTFTATGADALGHPVPVTPGWHVEGGVGTIGAGNGAFSATVPGRGLVIAVSGSLADTAAVTVLPPAAIAVRSVTGPASVVQGQTGVAFGVRVENAASGPVALDTLRLSFGRVAPGDANGEFSIAVAPALPIVLAAGERAEFTLTVDVSLDALLAPLVVNATASGVESATGARLRDAAADTTLALGVLPGGVQFTANQVAATVRPGTPHAVLMTLDVANRYSTALTLEQLTLTNTTTSPGGQAQQDDDLGLVALYRDDGDGGFDAARDTLVMQSAAFNARLLFSPAGVRLAPQATTRLFITTSLPLVARDGDVLDVELASAADVELDPSAAYRNGWPVNAVGGLTVDGMVAAQLAVAAVGPATLNPGAVDRLAFEVLLPPNGYAADVLTRLGVGNAGTAQPVADIQRLRAWMDDGDGAFSAATDWLLGTLAYTGGGRWQLSGLAAPVSPAGARLYVTVDAASTAAQNTTIRLFLPAAPDPGVGMSSGNSGPLDATVTNPSQLTFSDADRVSFGAVPLAGGTASPGARALPLAGLVATNTYAVPRTLTTVVFHDATSGPGTQAERDGESKLLTLRADGNGNGALDATDVDPVLSTGFFQSGQVAFTGLSVALAPGGSRTLFLTADLSTSGARDGDIVSARVNDAASVDFSEATTVAGVFPLEPGAGWTIDGLTAAQITNLGAPGATVGPGDGPILALDVIVPRNGYAADLLRGVRVTNLGTASASDFSLVQLWQDGGDGAFAGGGDDVLLGPLTSSGADWASPLLSAPVAGPGLRLFVSVSVAASPAETTTVRLAVPAGGIEYESTNDGPLDAAVANPVGLLISSSPLLASINVPNASTVGQPITVSMVVRNRSSEIVRNVSAPVMDVAGSAPFSVASGPTPPAFDLAPGAADTITWSYVASAVGDAQFSAIAGGTGDPSGLPRNAPRATSATHRVFLAAQNLELTPVQTMPIRVNRGQVGVVPFSLTLVHPGGANASDVRLDRLRIRLEEETGAPIVPSSLLDGVEVNEGTNVYLTRTGVETSGSTVDLPLATPVVVTGTQPATVSLRLNIAASTTVPTFRVVFPDSTYLSAQDATSGAPVTVRLQGASYPLRSEVARIVAEATEVDVASLGPDTVRTSPGQADATIMRLRLTSPGITGISSNVRVNSMAVALTDSAGADLARPGGVFGTLRLRAGVSIVATRALAPADGDSVILAFDPPVELTVNVPLDLTLVGDVVAGAPLGRYGSRLLDSTRVEARDVDTRAPIPARYDSAVVRGGLVVVESPADTLFARGAALLPPAVAIGQTDVAAIAATLRHPGGPGTARLRIDSMTIQLLDDLRRPVVPAGTLGRLRVRWNGIDQADLTSLPTSGDRVLVPLPGLLLEPGDTARVEVRIDIDVAAAAGFLELAVPADELDVRDANSGQPATLAGEPGAPLPLHSGLTRMSPPARDLAFGLASLMPAALAGDGRAVSVARLTLRNTDAQGVGPIEVDHLLVRAADRLFAARAVGAAVTQVEAWLNGTPWAQSAPLTPDSTTATLVAAQPLTVAPGTTAALELRIVTRPGAVTPGLRLGLDRADVGVVQPASALLAINVGPEAGLSFPMWTESGVMAEANLETSYVNYPNPFAAGREATTVAYFMPSPGRVTLRVLTARGDLVTTLVDGVARGAGEQQVDRWNGRNGRGDVVTNGVYVAELEVRFDDGTARHLRRKLAVVR